MIGPTGVVAPFLGSIVWYLLAASKDSVYVVFGRPGAGKTTVANIAVEKLNQNIIVGDDCGNDASTTKVLGLDLDICVPNWMKENFANGIYPTLEQRIVFAENACDYVAKEQQQQQQSNDVTKHLISVISFSFVNTDLRDVFRSRFPEAEWILVDTSPEEANRRIQQREDHFYKQETSDTDNGNDDQEKVVDDDDDDDTDKNDNPDNDDWNFAPVTFPHVILDGNNKIEANAEKIAHLILEKQKSLH